MKRLVTVTERHTYEVDVDELLIHLGNYKLADSLGSAGAEIIDTEVVLVEIAQLPLRQTTEGGE